MRSYLVRLFALLGLLISFSSQSIAASAQPSVAPPNPDFVQYIANPQAFHPLLQGVSGVNATGHLPSPIDRSHMTGKQPIVKSNLMMGGPGNVSVSPIAFDLRTTGFVSPVRDQGACGSCWTFGSTGSLESNMLVAASGVPDFSENHLNVRHGFDWAPCAGGNSDISTAYMTRWGNVPAYAAGPVYETDDPYTSTVATSIAGLSPRRHLQEVLHLPNRLNATDNANWKYALQTYGAAYISYHSELQGYTNSVYWNSATSAYYYNGALAGNHAVTLIGWDDNYAASNFSTPPPGNGAFILKNNWGTLWGAAGYFYVSYYDLSLANATVFVNPQSATNYTRSYSYDPFGQVGTMGYGTASAWGSNVFTSVAGETLQAVSFYTSALNSGYEVSIYTNVLTDPSTGVLEGGAVNTIGTTPYAGYHTVTLSRPVTLVAGQKFAVVVKFTTPGYNFPIPTEGRYIGYDSAATALPGESYISSTGVTWTETSAGANPYNVNIRAFTQSVNYTVTPSAGVNGTITPATPIAVSSGSTAIFTVTPSAGYGAVMGGTCGGTLNGSTFTTNPVMGACTVSATFALTTNQAIGAISFLPATLVAGGATTVSAAASSALPVTFSSLTPTICSVVGNTVRGVAVGSCSIAANQAGNATFAAAPQVIQNIPVSIGSQIISFGVAPAIAVGGTGVVLASGGASGNAVTFTSTTPAVCTVLGNVVTGVANGICTIAANQAGSVSYTAAPQVVQNIMINIPAPTGVVATAGNAQATLSWVASAGATSYKVYWSTAAGFTPLTAMGSVAGVVGTSTVVTGLVNGTKYFFIVTAVNAVGESAPNAKVSGTFTDGAENGLGAWVVGVPWGKSTTAFHTGVTAFTDSPLGNYANNASTSLALAAPLDFSQAVNPILTFWHQYTLESGFDYGYVEVSTDGGTIWSTPLATYSGALAAWTQVSINLSAYIGQPAVKIRFRLISDYSIAYDGWYVDDISISGVLSQASATPMPPLAIQTITFGAAPALMAGGTGLVSATGGTSGNPVIFTSLTPTICSVVGSTVRGVAVGSCSIAANQAGSATFAAAPQVIQNIPVSIGSQVISFGAAPAIAMGGTGVVLASGGASGNAVTFTSTTPAVCTVLGNVVTGVANGICTIAANQAGSVSYTAAPQVVQNIMINIPAPTGVVATAGNAQATLSWVASAGATSYKVYWSTAAGFTPLTAMGSVAGVVGTSTVVTGLVNGTKYFFIVTAVNAVGESAPNAKVSGTFTDGAENGLGAWVVGVPWGKSTTAFHTGVTAFTDSPLGNYANNASTSLALAAPLDFSQAVNPILTFWHQYTLESGFDYGYVEVSTDGGTIWSTPLATYSGALAAWTQVSINLSAYIGQPSVKIRFRLISDFSIAYDGWYVDDISISGAATVVSTTPMASQTIIFGAAPAIMVGGVGGVSATGGASGNPVTFTSLTPTICSVVGNTVTGIAVGSCSIAANQAGNSTFAAASQVTQNVNIGVASIMTVTPSTLNFPARNIGNPSAAQVVTLTNSGSTVLSIAGILTTGNFAHTTTCGTALAVGASCTISVSFTASAVGARTGSVTVSSTAVTSPNVITLTGTGKAAYADFNGDGKSDLLWRNPSSGVDAIWIMNDTTLVSNTAIATVPAPWAIAGMGDFNGDGKSDILWRNPVSGADAIWLMSGTTLLSNTAILTIPVSVMIAGVGDFNGDGKSDILWRNPTSGANAIWLMNGTTLVSNMAIATVPAPWLIAGTGDFNGDGKSDILWRNPTSGADAIWLMNGATLVSNTAITTVPAPWGVAGTGDYNGDGKSDILWRDSTTGGDAIWLMNGTTLLSNTAISTVSVSVMIAAEGDFNGDGSSDIVWRNPTTGADAIWLMNGVTLLKNGAISTVPSPWALAK
ncbi:MAG: lectin like domain-containing protein [Gallionella sp.]|nr:lectin like domain-containing protein [Gallionella sp.]